jgi:hypothetical protein
MALFNIIKNIFKSTSTHIPIIKKGNLLFVLGKVENEMGAFVIDTGSSVNLLSESKIGNLLDQKEVVETTEIDMIDKDKRRKILPVVQGNLKLLDNNHKSILLKNTPFTISDWICPDWVQVNCDDFPHLPHKTLYKDMDLPILGILGNSVITQFNLILRKRSGGELYLNIMIAPLFFFFK